MSLVNPPPLKTIPLQRGAEWYVFDQGRIREIRACYASPADKAMPANELVDFDYAGGGYHLQAR